MEVSDDLDRCASNRLDASVVIATRNREKSIRDVLNDLALQTHGRAFEVVVVDDRSDPPLQLHAHQVHGNITLLRGTGEGPARARNLGWRAARAELIIFTDDDVRIPAGWVDAACLAFEADHELVAVEGRVDTRPFDWLFEYSFTVEHAGGGLTCNVAYRRSTLAHLGGFDERFPDPACEDQDLLNRAMDLGPTGFVEDMVVEHIPRTMTVGDFGRRGRFAKSEVRLIRLHRQRYSRWIPASAYPVVYHGRHWLYIAYHERGRLLTEPNRACRWLLAAVADLGCVFVTLSR